MISVQGRGRDQEGRFTKSDDVGRSPSQTTVELGHGHKGDQKRKK